MGNLRVLPWDDTCLEDMQEHLKQFMDNGNGIPGPDDMLKKRKHWLKELKKPKQ